MFPKFKYTLMSLNCLKWIISLQQMKAYLQRIQKLKLHKEIMRKVWERTYNYSKHQGQNKVLKYFYT